MRLKSVKICPRASHYSLRSIKSDRLLVRDKLSDKVIKGAHSKDMQDTPIKQSAEPVGRGLKEFAAFIKAETVK